MIEAAQHNFDQTGDTYRVAQFMESFILPVAADILHMIVSHRHELAKSQERVVHYTSASCLFSMFKNGRIRLYDSDNSNDPSEGAYFDQHSQWLSDYSWLKAATPMPVYIASFVISDPSESDRPCRDDLVYWRTYGDSGRGCSIEFLASSRGLQKVLYGQYEVEATAESLRGFLSQVDPLIEPSSPIGSRLADLIAEALNSIRHLYKSEDYEYEHECRLVVLKQQQPLANIHIDFDRAHGGSSVRHYCYDDRLKLKGMLDATESTITIGPAAPSQEALERTIRVALEKLGFYSAAAVKFSRISFRRN
ncbi:MAG: DUF2971 domain-containing protein [Acidimicrobiaceae bacterium]|nr:DUF2971 domain-containing protein [Acidimicrobiaceae bacterium]MYL03284.1 DUF2971 domain-containing protein [Acidimicrobiaceae bacterium]